MGRMPATFVPPYSHCHVQFQSPAVSGQVIGSASVALPFSTSYHYRAITTISARTSSQKVQQSVFKPVHCTFGLAHIRGIVTIHLKQFSHRKSWLVLEKEERTLLTVMTAPRWDRIYPKNQNRIRTQPCNLYVIIRGFQLAQFHVFQKFIIHSTVNYSTVCHIYMRTVPQNKFEKPKLNVNVHCSTTTVESMYDKRTASDAHYDLIHCHIC